MTDLITYLPPHLRKYRELKYIMQTEAYELATISQTADDILKNAFVSDADENGISRYEKMLNTSLNSDIENRRLNILARYMPRQAFTMKHLENYMETYYSGSTVMLNNDKYSLSIRLHLKYKVQLAELTSYLRQMIPANIYLDIDLKYNTDEDLAAYPKYILNQFTKSELKDTWIEGELSASWGNISQYSCEELNSIPYGYLKTYGMRKKVQS